MLVFEPSLSNPLLQIAVSVSEPTIRQACLLAGVYGAPAGESPLRIAAALSQLPDGRDSIIITLSGGTSTQPLTTHFEMLLRNYFDAAILFRVACRAWLRARQQPPHAPGRLHALAFAAAHPPHTFAARWN